MNACVNSYSKYYNNIVHSITQTLKSFVPIFILKMICKKKKLSYITIVTGTDGNFRLSGTVSAVPRQSLVTA